MSPGAALFKFLYSNQFVVQMVPTPKLKQEIASYAYETLKTLDIIRPPLYSKGVPEFWEQNYMVFIEWERWQEMGTQHPEDILSL